MVTKQKLSELTGLSIQNIDNFRRKYWKDGEQFVKKNTKVIFYNFEEIQKWMGVHNVKN